MRKKKKLRFRFHIFCSEPDCHFSIGAAGRRFFPDREHQHDPENVPML